MSKKILIDAAQPQEIRVAVVDEKNHIADLDFEQLNGFKTLKGNIYLAKVLRVEQSLQAVFVDYGNERQGFLSFNEIHQDYFNIPKEEKKQVIEVISDTAVDFGPLNNKSESENSQHINLHKKYSVQQVIKQKQTLLVQVVKEERGNKCAALTTYISLAGRYCVLMPNTPGKLGVSRNINGSENRQSLKNIMAELDVDPDMSLVVRTAGDGKSKKDIERDYKYLLNEWNKISSDAKKLSAPVLIYEESGLIKRTLRDTYDGDGEVIIDGEEAYKIAKNFVKLLMPSQTKHIKLFHRKNVGLFQFYNLEEQINNVYSPRIDLPSGGYIVINHTEALIAIDINSGKSTKERNVEETALKTNLEAAEEISRQMIIRNLSGIVVVDFIDMENPKNNIKIEQAMQLLLKKDKARTQCSKLSALGLMEISRQMLKPSIIQSKSKLCPHCAGLGYIQTSETVGIRLIRSLQFESVNNELLTIEVKTTPSVAMNVLNNYRHELTKIENDNNVKILISIDYLMTDCTFEFVKTFKETNDLLVDDDGINSQSENKNNSKNIDVEDIIEKKVKNTIINNDEKGNVKKESSLIEVISDSSNLNKTEVIPEKQTNTIFEQKKKKRIKKNIEIVQEKVEINNNVSNENAPVLKDGTLSKEVKKTKNQRKSKKIPISIVEPLQNDNGKIIEANNSHELNNKSVSAKTKRGWAKVE